MMGLLDDGRNKKSIIEQRYSGCKKLKCCSNYSEKNLFIDVQNRKIIKLSKYKIYKN
jgi:hypothetical protein